MAPLLFEDIFNITRIDPDGKKFDKDRYEYVMHGRTYRITDIDYEGQEKGEIFVSFGGLLMMMRVDKSVSKNFQLDQRLFLLMKRTE
ncbi:hypothetical protein SOVF_032000 [Spinacia oleracea]|nr:hypothetical protein SOVF_032000 [Spinacia oleracea]